MILLQQVLNPDSLLHNQVTEKVFDISPTNVYGWLVWGLLGFIGYLKIESTIKSYTIRQKDKYIKELTNKLLDSEQSSITEQEAAIYKKIIDKENKQIPA